MIRKTLLKAASKLTSAGFQTYVATLLRVASWRVAVALVMTLLISGLQAARLLLLIPLMQLVGLRVHGGSIGWFNELVESMFAVVGLRTTLGTVLLALLIFTTVVAVLNRWLITFNYALQEEFAAYFRRRLYRAIGNTNWLTFIRTRASDFTHALTTELDRVSLATSLLLLLVTNAVMIVIYVMLALRLSGIMTALVFICGMGLLFAMRRKSRLARMTGEEISYATNGIYAATTEYLGGMKTVKSYGAEGRSADLFSKLADRVVQKRIDSVRHQADSSFWFGVGSMTILCVILYIAFKVFAITAAELLLLLFIFNRIIPLFSSIQQQHQQFLNVVPAFEVVMRILTRCEAEIQPKPESQESIELRDGIRFDAVSFSYGGEEKAPALDDIDLTIREGEITAVVGPSGAGKSTFADLVMGLIVPNEGRVLVDATPLSAERTLPWRNQIGYVPQETFLFNDTVKANLLWARPEADDDDIVQALRSAAAEGFVTGLPEGINTVLGDRGVRLSGGERQRLALARALLRKPSLLILDEATSALDSENERRIQDAIEKLHGRMTILVITHRLSTIRKADAIHVVEDGRLVESGDWNTLLDTRDGRFRALCLAQGIEGIGETHGNGTTSSRAGSGSSRVGNQ
jgi:ATP-binding cassette subfamily C protein